MEWNGSTIYNPVQKQMLIATFLTNIISSSAMKRTKYQQVLEALQPLLVSIN